MAVSNVGQSNANYCIDMLKLVNEDLDEASQTSCVLRGVVIAPLQCQVEPVKDPGRSTPDTTHFWWHVLMNRAGLRGRSPSTFVYQLFLCRGDCFGGPGIQQRTSHGASK